MNKYFFVLLILAAAMFPACSNSGSQTSATQVQKILPETAPATNQEIQETITTQSPGSSIDQAAPIKNP